MLNRRSCFGLLGAGLLGVGRARSDDDEAKADAPLLEILTKRSPYVFAVEIVAIATDEIADGEVSMYFQNREAKLIEAIRGKKPAGNFHVSIGHFTKHSGFSAAKGVKFVLFLEPYDGKGELGESMRPYVTIDPWFGVLPYSEILVEELKKFAKS